MKEEQKGNVYIIQPSRKLPVKLTKIVIKKR
ncbi:hypothetical protein [Bacillus taeanensis]